MTRIRLTTAILVLCLLSSTALADRPFGFRRTQVYIQPSFQTSHFIGPLADKSSWSVGFGLTQGVQLGYLGLNITIDTDYFLTTETAQPPPFNRGLQLARVKLGGRFVYPLGNFWPFAEISATRISLISNALVQDTGPELNAHSVGGSLGIRFLQLAPLYLELQTSWQRILDLSDTHIIGFNLAVGLRSIL